MSDWLPQPFSQLSGPAFLLVYAAFAAAVILVSRLQVRSADTSLELPLPPVSAERDPYEIAFLRGGGNELLRFAIFDGIRRNALRLAPPAAGRNRPQRIEAAPQAPAWGSGSALPAALTAFYAQPRTTEELFASTVPATAASVGENDYGATLQAERFLTDASVRRAATRVRWYGVAALVIFAGLRLLEALERHHRNVGFLLLETLLAVVLLLAFTQVGRVSRRGRAFLQRLQAALRPAAGGAPAVAGAALLPIFVAASGLNALAGTEFAPVRSLFPRQLSSGDAGGACGSSSSGSSCGGGGGCGGGGCGG